MPKGQRQQRLAPRLAVQKRAFSQFKTPWHAVYGCTGKYPMPCREAWPVSRFAWCEGCRGR